MSAKIVKQTEDAITVEVTTKNDASLLDSEEAIEYALNNAKKLAIDALTKQDKANIVDDEAGT